MCQIKISLFNVVNVTNDQKVIYDFHILVIMIGTTTNEMERQYILINSVFVVVVLILHRSKSGVK